MSILDGGESGREWAVSGGVCESGDEGSRLGRSAGRGCVFWVISAWWRGWWVVSERLLRTACRLGRREAREELLGGTREGRASEDGGTLNRLTRLDNLSRRLKLSFRTSSQPIHSRALRLAVLSLLSASPRYLSFAFFGLLTLRFLSCLFNVDEETTQWNPAAKTESSRAGTQKRESQKAVFPLTHRELNSSGL